MDVAKLENAFNSMQSKFFPELDHENGWSVIFDPNLENAVGMCDGTERIIRIKPIQIHTDWDELCETLIHEICHIFHVGHTRAWFDRMFSAAIKAHELKLGPLAKKITADALANYNGAKIDKEEIVSEIAEEDIEDDIEGYVMDEPDASYKEVIKNVAYNKYLHPYELEKVCPRTRDIYEEIRKDLKLDGK